MFEPDEPTRTSPTRWVPPGVPSEVHSSLPCVPSSAANQSAPFHRTIV